MRLAGLQEALKEKEGEKRSLDEQRKSLDKQLASAKVGQAAAVCVWRRRRRREVIECGCVAVCCQVRERELDDNLQLLHQREEMGAKRGELAKLKEQLKKKGLEKYEE